MKQRKTPSRRGRSRGGVLTVISLLMVGSAVIRLGLEAGPALAKAADPSQPLLQPASQKAPDVQVLLTELLRREEQLVQRENTLLNREKALEIADQAIESRLIALQQAEQDLRATLAIADTAAESDLSKLTDMCQSMKPKDAAALFETMDPVFSAGFLA
nr:hypothetical protein [uncultured Ruegeria sp.]